MSNLFNLHHQVVFAALAYWNTDRSTEEFKDSVCHFPKQWKNSKMFKAKREALATLQLYVGLLLVASSHLISLILVPLFRVGNAD